MDHGGEAARSTELGMAGAVPGSQANVDVGTATFDGQLAAAARRASFEPTAAAAYHNSAEFVGLHVRAAAGRGEVPVAVFHRAPGPGVVYASIGASWQQVDVVPFGLQPPGRVVPAVHEHGSAFYSALQPRPGAGRGVVLAVAALLPGGADAVYSGDYAPPQLRPGAGHGPEVLDDLLPDAAGHGEAFVRLLPGADGVAGALRGPNLGAVYDNRGVRGEHLRRLLPFVGIGASSVAVNGLAAAGPGSPVVAFHFFVLLLGSVFLVILHVLRLRV